MYAPGYATKPNTPLRSDRALRHVYRWALVLVAALAVMLALSRIAQGGGASATLVVDTRMRVDEIEQLNNLSSPVISVGETLRLPA